MSGGISRRGVLTIAGSTVLLNSAAQQVAAQLAPVEEESNIYGIVLDASRPSQGELDAIWDQYRLIHIHPVTGAEAAISHHDNDWVELPAHLPGYAVGDLPTDVDSGTMVFDTNRGLPSWWDRDHYERPNFVDNRDVMITPQTVANTTTETQVFSIGFNEDSMVQGRVYQLDLMGTFSTTNNSDMFTIGIDLGGTEIATLANEPANATGVPWSMETTYTVRSHGESGEVQPHTRGVFNSITKDDHHPVATVDTTSTEMLSVTVTWSAADPSNTVTLEQAHLKQMA